MPNSARGRERGQASDGGVGDCRGEVCFLAAFQGHLDILRWAKSMGCPWDYEAAPYVAAMNGHLEVLVWLIKEGYPCNKSMCRRAAVAGGKRARKVLEWIDKYKFKF